MRRLSGGLGGLTALSSLAGGHAVKNVTSGKNNRARSRLANCGRYCRLTLTFLFSHIGLGALVVGYALIGASVFSMLERPSCIQARMDATEKREALVNNLLKMTKNLTIIRYEDWKGEARLLLDGYTNYLGEVVKKRGYDGKDEQDQSKWDFLQSLLYSVIVITTIGYGDAVPKTDQGKLATILYAIVGIPLMLVFLSTIGDIMAHAFKFFYWQICCTICFRPRVKRISKKQRRKRKERRRLRNFRRQERAKMAALAAISALQQQQLSLSRTPPPPTTPVPNKVGNQFPMTPATPPPSVSTQQNSTSNTSGSASHPQADQPFRFPLSTSSASGLEYSMADANRVPILINKYAMQQESNDRTDTPDLAIDQRTYESLYADHGKTVSNRFLDLELQQRLLADMQTKLELCSSESDSDSDFDEKEHNNVPIPVCLALIVGYICGGAFLFLEIQQTWQFEEAMYFCFITLTTIGFGDYLPKTEDIAIRDSKGALILCSLYTIFGMALIAMSFNLLKDETTRILKGLAVTIGLVSKQEG